MITKRTFNPTTSSVPAVRHFVLNAVKQLPSSALDTAGLLVSELATNAVLYGGTKFRVTVRCEDDQLVVTVTDRGSGTPLLNDDPSPSEPHGRGLLIVSQLADGWGIDTSPEDGTTAVWFLLDLGHVATL